MVMLTRAAHLRLALEDLADRRDRERRSEGRRQSRKRVSVGTWNILDGRGDRLELACQRLARHNLDIALVTETKLCGFHTTCAYRFNIHATRCGNQHQGSVALLVAHRPEWHVEGVQQFGANVISCTLVHDAQRTRILGVYRPPSDDELHTVQDLDRAMDGGRWEDTIALGDINVNLRCPCLQEDKDVAEAIASYDLVDLTSQFKARVKKPFCWTWRQVPDGQRVQAICDYILTGQNLRWKNCRLVDVSFDSDHRLLKGDLILGPPWRYKAYLAQRQTPPVPVNQEAEGALTRTANLHLAEVRTAVPKKLPEEAVDRSWISPATFEWLRKKAIAVRQADSEGIRRYGQELRRQLRADRWRRIRNVATVIEAAMDR